MYNQKSQIDTANQLGLISSLDRKELNTELVYGIFTLGGAILLAVLTGTITWFQNKQNRPRSELSIFTSPTAGLIEVDSSISEIVEIRVRGEIVPTVYTLDTRIANTGTETILDGDIHVTLVGDAKVLAVDIADFSEGARDALAVELNKQSEGFRVHFNYINPDEEFLLRVLLSARPSTVEPLFRKPGIKTRVRTDYDPMMPGVMGRVLLEIIRTDWILHPYFKLLIPSYRRYIEQMDKNKHPL